MQLKNTPQRYGLVAMLLHWILAVVILGLFGLGLYMVELSYYDTWYRGSLELHKSVGILLAIASVFRLVWRFYSRPPAELASNSPRMNQVAKWAHRILYLILSALLITGYLISTADGRSIDVFGWFEVTAIPAILEHQEDIAGTIHWGLAWILIALVVLHAMAALKHHFIDKDETLTRILP